METTVRKLIDVELPVVRILSQKARSRNMTFKRYVEQLIERDAASGSSAPGLDCIESEDLKSLVGIAKTKRSVRDDKLEYILSKL